MKLAGLSLSAFCVFSCAPAEAGTSLPAWSAPSPDGAQKTWHATLDQRDLPAGTRPSRIRAQIDGRALGADWPGPLRVIVSVNGTVVGRGEAVPGGLADIGATIADRLLSTRNAVSVAVTSSGEPCGAAPCPVSGVQLAGGIRFDTAPAMPVPLTFAQLVTGLREGLVIRASSARDRALAEAVATALAPRAPRNPRGPAEIAVSHDLPAGVDAPLRFDTGPVSIDDRDGRVVYDRARLDRLTIVQIARRGDAKLIWVRPGTEPLPPAPLDLDYGNIALFGAGGREIAFSPRQDHALAISYGHDAARAAKQGLIWRLIVAAVWLAATAGLVVLLRRTAPAASRLAQA